MMDQTENRPQNPKGGGRGSNLSDEDRRRGGQESAQRQRRDERGKFAGRQGGDVGKRQRGQRTPTEQQSADNIGHEMGGEDQGSPGPGGQMNQGQRQDTTP